MNESSNETLDLRSYLRPLRTRWWIVVLVGVVAAGFTYQYYSGKPTRYAAATTLLLEPQRGFENPIDRDRIAREQSLIIGTRVITRLVATELGIAKGPLPGSVKAVPSAGTAFLVLDSSSSDQRSAVALVNAYARVYIRYSGNVGRKQAKNARIAAERRLAQILDIPKNRLTRLQLEETIQTLGLQENSGQASAQQIEPAVAATPIRPTPRRNAIFALVLGALLGLGLAYGLEHLDRRLKRLEELGELYDSPVLVAIPRAPGAAKASRVEHRLEPPLTEAFRTLRTTLQLHATDTDGDDAAPLRTMLVTSAIAGEGKSTVARSLAIAYYEAGLRVALVDADLRRPTLADSFSLDTEPGLTDVLHGRPLTDALRVVWQEPTQQSGSSAVAEADPATAPATVGASAERARPSGLAFGARRRQPSEPAPAPAAPAPPVASNNSNHPTGVARFSVLPSGRAPRDPAALLAGGPVDEVLRALEASHDIVIVDTSPLLPVSDAVPLLAAVDGVLVVSRLGVTNRHAVSRLTDLLARVPHVKLLGIVANDVRQQAGYGYGGYGYGRA